MITVLCPTLLFIREDDWMNTDIKDTFLNNLKNAFDYILNNNNFLYWNDNLEELLWDYPMLLPWYCNESYRLIELMQKCKVLKNESCDFIPCNISPDLVNSITEKDIFSPTLALIHYIIKNNLDFLFIVDEKNYYNFIVSCDCHKISYNPTVKCISNLKDIDIPLYIEEKWEEFTRDEHEFKKTISLFIKEYFKNTNALYTLEFSPSFLSEINLDKKNKKDILYSIANRITKNQKEATNNKSLKDEPIRGYNNRRSFRTNGECRIQYTYPSKGVIKLITYSSEGEHNKKLSHTRR